MKPFQLKLIMIFLAIIYLAVALPGGFNFGNTYNKRIIEDGVQYDFMGSVVGYDLYMSKQDFCAEMIEDIYKDEQFTYYFPCLMSGRYRFVKSGVRYSVKRMLEEERMSPEEMMLTLFALRRRLNDE